MIILVPLSKFRVHYEIAEGYPFSAVERLVLKAVAEEVASVEELVRLFYIHPRLLIEALITLLHAGWVALGDSQKRQFVITLAGVNALAGGDLPDSIELKRRKTIILLDRVSGGIVPDGEVRCITKRELKKADLWKDCVVLKSRVFDNRLDEGRVQHMLPRGQGQRLRWIGPIDLESRGFHYLPLMVSVENGSVVNLPERWDPELRMLAIETARAEFNKREFSSSITWEGFSKTMKYEPRRFDPRVRNRRRCWALDWHEEDLMFSHLSCLGLLTRALKEATTAILVVSQCLAAEALMAFEGDILRALSRGVDIDILPAKLSLPAMASLKKMAYDSKASGATGRLRFPIIAPRRCGNAVLWDRADGCYRGAILGGDFLGADPAQDGFVVGIAISHPAILSELSWYFAGVWSEDHSEALSSAPTRWRQIAAQLEEGTRDVPTEFGKDPEEVVAEVRFDREVTVGLAQLISSAQVDALLIGVCDSNSRPPQVTRASKLPLKYVFASNTAAEALRGFVQEYFGNNDATAISLPRFAGNLVAADRTICFTTAEVLGISNNYGSSQIALVIDGIIPARQIKMAVAKFASVMRG